jgi:IQ motif and SEC7 domain-containing protein
MYSHNVAAISSPQHFNHHNHNHSPSSTSTATKTSSIRYGSNSELSKRTRNQSYELSQDLIEKQIELLERKYGGSVRAQRAALVIQRAFRSYMMNRKFASIRANVKVDRRSSSSSRMTTSQSMDMSQRQASPLATPMRSAVVKTQQHPYVNLMHQHAPYQLQYQNQSTPEMSQWNQPAPLVQHYTAAQIYMRPKALASQQSSPTLLNKKPPPPEVPKRLSSSITGSQSSLKKSNGLSRSGELKAGVVDHFPDYFDPPANNGSLQSVQSSGSESSVSIEKLHYENFSDRGTSPLWKRKDVDDEESPARVKKNSATENFKISEIIRKRKYRIGLNLFNKKPDRGIEFLVKNGECKSGEVGTL